MSPDVSSQPHQSSPLGQVASHPLVASVLLVEHLVACVLLARLSPSGSLSLEPSELVYPFVQQLAQVGQCQLLSLLLALLLVEPLVEQLLSLAQPRSMLAALQASSLDPLASHPIYAVLNDDHQAQHQAYHQDFDAVDAIAALSSEANKCCCSALAEVLGQAALVAPAAAHGKLLAPCGKNSMRLYHQHLLTPIGMMTLKQCHHPSWHIPS